MANGYQRRVYLLRFLWSSFGMLLLLTESISASHGSANCTNVKCPPMSEIHCPDDSYIREVEESSMNVIETNENHEIVEEVFVRCCMAKKCACKNCEIPSCQNSSFVVHEIIPETQTPGQCCGQYECIHEPNCTEVKNTEGPWLIDCQRCSCVSGERICHRSCDEHFQKYCKSMNLNRFFKNGETWKDGCSECECRDGEVKCVVPFCKSVDCPQEKQVMNPEDNCCPICHDDDQLIDDLDLEYDYAKIDNDEDTLRPKIETEHTHEPKLDPVIINRPVIPPGTVYTEVVEVIRPSRETCVLYGIIGALLTALLFSVFYNIRLTKRHSYRTVSSHESVCESNSKYNPNKDPENYIIKA